MLQSNLAFLKTNIHQHYKLLYNKSIVIWQSRVKVFKISFPFTNHSNKKENSD